MAVFRSEGNPHTHVVLRGGASGPNYSAKYVAACEKSMSKIGVIPNIMIDCSHANSCKKPEKQLDVIDDVIQQIQGGNRSITSLMIESNIEWGNQAIPDDLTELRYGVSVTDACIDWQTTIDVIRKMYKQLHDVLPNRAQL